MATDNYYSYVGLLLHGNGINAATTFPDNSPIPKTASAFGNVQVDTSDVVYGTGAILFDGTGDYISLPTSTDWQFGTGDFTIELWLKTSATNSPVIFDYYTAAQPGWQLALNATGKMLWYTTTTIKTGAIAVNNNAWHHIAVVRSSGNIQFYVDGVADGAPVVHATNLSYATSVLGIGAQVSTRNASFDFAGRFDDIRITKGVARYTTGFTAPTGEFGDSGPSTLATLPLLTIAAFGGGNAAAQLPKISMYAGLIGSGTAGITLPQLTTNIYGASAGAFTLPALTAYSTGHDSTGDRAADITLPSLSVAIRTGAKSAVSLPELGVQVSGTVTLLAQAVASLPRLSASASGTVAATGTVDISLPSFRAAAYSGALCSVTLGSVTLQAEGTANGVGSAQITLPLFQATATATVQNRGAVNIVLPSLSVRSGGNGVIATLPSLSLTSVGTAVVAVSYEAYAVNLGHLPRVTNQEIPVDEVTHYTNFPFTHVVRYKGSYYGANSTGLYLLDGTTDSGTPIPFAVKTCETDFDKPEHKTVESVYFAGRIGNAETVTLFAREETTHVQTFTTPRNTKPQSHRQMFARGLKSRYFALGLSGSKEFELDTIDLSVGTTKRRI